MAKRLTVKRAGQYLDCDGDGCPFCGPGVDITGEPVEITGGAAQQEVTCIECGAAWYDLYTLTGVELKSPPEK